MEILSIHCTWSCSNRGVRPYTVCPDKHSLCIGKPLVGAPREAPAIATPTRILVAQRPARAVYSAPPTRRRDHRACAERRYRGITCSASRV